MPQNRATIYSNGIAELHRVFKVNKTAAAKISIPVRQLHLADVLASLTISGDVKIESPPSYQPANVDDGNLAIHSDSALLSLASQLSGADVAVSFGQDRFVGQLIGLQDFNSPSNGEPYTETHLVVMADGALRRIPVKEVISLEFTDEVIQAEIQKALSRKLRTIKPNSTFVDFELSTEKKDAEAIVQYTIPAAAWKISYRLILLPDNKIEFHGHAIVDNNTDEDWKDFVVAVVMGQPITFTSDLADSKTPTRSHVNIVQASAVGAIEVEEAMELSTGSLVMRAAGGGDAPREDYGQRRSKRKSPPAPAAVSAPMKKKQSLDRDFDSAGVVQAKVEDSGDFCIFESPNPVSIEARRSAVIPVFQTTLDSSKSVLHYKFENHEERPFRSIEFVNSMEHSVGRGICTVFDEATYVGSCIVPALKQDDDALLPHAMEMGVKVKRKLLPVKSRRIGVQISDGVVVESVHKQSASEYRIKSSSERASRFVLDHVLRISDSKVESDLLRLNKESQSLELKELERGRRIEFELQAKESLVVKVVEEKIEKTRVRLIGKAADENFQVRWLFENFVDADTPLAENQAVMACIKLQEKLDKIDQQVNHARAEIERLCTRQDRLRKNIKTGGGDQQDIKWQTDLGKAENQIVKLEEKEIPDFQKQREDVREELFRALKDIVLDWAE